MEKDIVCNVFFSDNERYADIINGIGCKGVPFVAGKDLQELDTRVMPVRTGNPGRKRKRAAAKYRDLLRKASFGMNFAIIGIESQEKIDYALVLRAMGYDAGEYGRQAATIRKEVRKRCKDLESGEYMYGFRKDSRLFPTVTFILYFGEEEWDGARNLHDILDFEGIPESLRELVASYVEDSEVLKIKEKHRKGGKVDMSKGLREWLEDEREEGRAEGRAEAIIDLLSDYGTVSGHLKGIIMKEKDLEILREWMKTAAMVDSVEEFERKM